MFRPFLLSLCLVASAPAWSATDCPQHFAGGVAPAITNPKLQARTQEVCFERFALLHSGLSRTALYSAEHLTRANLEAAQVLSRRDSFHPESALPAQDRSELSDYARSGYDRGHLSPNKDMPTPAAQGESFSLANMIPQRHVSNAGIWEGIENVARRMAIEEGELYVVSGPAFLGSNLQRIGKVLVPTHIWKVLYSPSRHKAGAYVVTNDESRDYQSLSVSALQQLVGVNALPGVSAKIRDCGMDLPAPLAKSNAQKTTPAAAACAAP